MSWALVISEWGVIVVVHGGPSLSLGIVVVGTVVVHGARRCHLGAQSLFVGLGCCLRVPCCRWWVLGVVEGHPAVVWGW